MLFTSFRSTSSFNDNKVDELPLVVGEVVGRILISTVGEEVENGT